MRPEASSHLRIARPWRDLEAAERFWVDGLGLEVQWRTTPDAVVDRPVAAGGTRAWP